jgi:cytochrome c oxidase subunit 2
MNRILACSLVAGGFVILLVMAACVAIVAIDLSNRISHDRSMSGPRWFQGSDSRLADSDDPVERGQAIYERNCSGCHSIDGQSRVGPTLAGLYGAEVMMDDGANVIVDEDHLRLAITDPQATTRDGYRDIMPAFTDFSDDQLDDLIAFIRSLR